MIHGTGYIIFKIGTTEYPLEESKIINFGTISKELELEDEIANEVEYYNHSERLNIDAIYNIYKNPDTIVQFKSIYALRNQDVKLRLNDGNYFLDEDGEESDFRMTMKPVHYETGDRKDYLLISFRSLKPVDLVLSALDEDTMFVERNGGLYPNMTEPDNENIISE